MKQTTEKTHIWTGLLVIGTVLGVGTCLLNLPIVPFGIWGYLLLSVVPGTALYRLVSREPGILESLTAGTALSPVLTTLVAVGAMLAGMSPRGAATLLVVLAGAAGVLAVQLGRPFRPTQLLTRRQAFALAALLILVSAAISYLPFTRDWWRMRSDAWFHAAVVAQVRDFGIPPEDPWIVGLPLQYMWFYHVFVVMLTQVSGIGPFMIMALINVQALVALGLTTFVLSGVFRKTFLHNFAATLTAIFGMNAAFWVFIPVELLRAFTGSVRGMEEVNRLLNLHPFDVTTVRRFAIVWYNAAFFLDKFMVATALSMGLSLMAAVWYGATSYATGRKPEALVTLCVASVGMVAFHAALGIPMLAGILGGLAFAIILKQPLGIGDVKPFVRMLALLLASGALLAPYLYSINHAKSGPGAIPLGFSGVKMIGIFVSCAFVLVAAAFQAKAVVVARSPATNLLVCTVIAVLGICTVFQLPGSNTADKLPLLFFYPLAVMGGWTIADVADRAKSPRRRYLRYVLVSLLAFAPLNVLQFAGYYNTAPITRLSQDEKRIAEWIREHTPRGSVILDSRQYGFLLVAGPRRYYLGNERYAREWGYDPAEVDRRRHVLNSLFATDSLEPFTLETLATIPSEAIIILRRDDPTINTRKFDAHPELFEPLYSSGAMSVLKVDRNACAEFAQRAQRVQ